MYVSITGPPDIKASSFTSLYLEEIASAMEDPKTHFIFSDEGSLASYIYKYLKGRKYQNFTIYHIGGHSRLVSKSTKSGFSKGDFSSYIEVNEALRQDAEKVISFTGRGVSR